MGASAHVFAGLLRGPCNGVRSPARAPIGQVCGQPASSSVAAFGLRPFASRDCGSLGRVSGKPPRSSRRRSRTRISWTRRSFRLRGRTASWNRLPRPAAGPDPRPFARAAPHCLPGDFGVDASPPREEARAADPAAGWPSHPGARAALLRGLRIRGALRHSIPRRRPALERRREQNREHGREIAADQWERSVFARDDGDFRDFSQPVSLASVPDRERGHARRAHQRRA